MRKSLGPALLILAAALALSSCGKDDGGPTSPGGGGGGIVTRELDSGLFGQGQTYEHVFRTAGTYPYHCEPHPDMTGTVTVSAGAESLATVRIPGRVPFAPASVRPGGRVTWINDDTMMHTVTSDDVPS